MCINALWHYNIINWKISQHEYFLSPIFYVIIIYIEILMKKGL